MPIPFFRKYSESGGARELYGTYGEVELEKRKRTKKENDIKQPWKIICQNVNRLVTKNSKDMVVHFKEYTSENNVILMNFTETWLNETIQQDEEIEGYQIFRCDRKGRDGGGTAIYVKDTYEAKVLSSKNTKECEMIAVHIEKINMLNIVIY